MTAIADLLTMQGRTALVSGGAGGIGSAVCAMLRDAGARVVALDRVGSSPPEGCEVMPCDLASEVSLRQIGEAIAAREPSFDVFVHAAGIARDAVVWKMTDSDWEAVRSVHLDAGFRLLRAVIPGMRAQGRGAVVLVASINGERGKFGQANYAASKAGLIALGRTAALEVGRFGIRVNAVSPGWIDTAMTQGLPARFRDAAIAETALARVGTAEDVAAAVLFLCSNASAHVTGQVLRVDGGQLMA